MPPVISLKNFPPLQVSPQDEQLQVIDNEELDLFHEGDIVEMQNETLANLKYKWLLISTLQWKPYTEKWETRKRRWMLFLCGQFFIIGLIVLSFFFDAGYFCSVNTPLELDWQFRLTRYKNILWESRWLLGNIIGIWYFRTRHLEWLLKAIYMPRRVWERFHPRSYWLLAFLMFTCIALPAGIHLLVISYLIHGTQLWKQLFDMTGYVLCRYTTLPVFAALIATLHLIELYVRVGGAMVKYYLIDALVMRGDDEEKGIELKANAINKATRESTKILGQMKKVISTTENSIKYFMLFHLSMLLLTAFLGIFSYMERIEFHFKPTPMTAKDSLALQPPVSNASKLMHGRIQNVIGNLVEISKAKKHSPKNKTVTMDLIKVLNETLSSMSDLPKSQQEIVNIMQTATLRQSLAVGFKEQLDRTRIFIQIGLDCMETALLYGLPLFLLIRLDTAVAAVQESLTNLQAMRAEYRFDMTSQVWEVISFAKTLRGIRIFGFQSTLFRTLILTFAGPFLVSIIHSMLSHVNMAK